MADSNRLDFSNIAFWLFAISLVLLPVGLAGNRPIPFGLAEIGFAACGFFLLRDEHLWKQLFFFKRLRIALMLFTLVILWALLQMATFLPQGWAHPVWQEASVALHQPLKGSIAIAPEDSYSGIMRLITYIACGVLAYILGQSTSFARKLVTFLWHAAVAICAYGMIVYLAGNKSLLWFEKWAYRDDLTATFVNSNHFAIFAGMAFIAGIALLIQSWREDVEPNKSRNFQEALRGWLVRRAVPQGMMLLLVMQCILLSHSRAGLILTLAGFFAYLFLHQLYLKAWRRSIIIAVFAALALALVLVAAVQNSSHFALLFSDYSSRDRLTVYKIMASAIEANPLLGYGINGFEPVFRLYQQGMVMEFNHGHSDLIESLFDLGLPMGFCLWAAVILLLSGLVRGVLNRRRFGLYPTLALAVSVTLIFHAAIDFSMQSPAVVCLWAALIGIGLAQSWKESEKQAALVGKVL